MRGAFREGFQSDMVDPLDGHGSTNFDWDALDKQCATPGRDYDALVCGIRRVLQWVVADIFTQRRPGGIAARRIIALAWLLSPDYFPNRPSLSWVASRLGVSRFKLAKQVARARKEFGLDRNRAQCHGRRKSDEYRQVQAEAERYRLQSMRELSAAKRRKAKR